MAPTLTAPMPRLATANGSTIDARPTMDRPERLPRSKEPKPRLGQIRFTSSLQVERNEEDPAGKLRGYPMQRVSRDRLAKKASGLSGRQFKRARRQARAAEAQLRGEEG